MTWAAGIEASMTAGACRPLGVQTSTASGLTSLSELSSSRSTAVGDAEFFLAQSRRSGLGIAAADDFDVGVLLMV